MLFLKLIRQVRALSIQSCLQQIMLVCRPVARECPNDTEESPSTVAESRTQEIQEVLGLYRSSRDRLLQTLRWTRSVVEHEDSASSRRIHAHQLVQLPALDESVARR